VRRDGLFYTCNALKYRRAFFKKWLELEKRLGDEDGENAVKAKAIEWTRRAGAGAAQ